MKPGRELDALVAEKIFGFEIPNPGGMWETAPLPYSTSISAAWEVVEKMNLLDPERMLFRKENGYWVIGSLMDQPAEIWEKFACESAPHVICLAALKDK